jgi:hypothetical protein
LESSPTQADGRFAQLLLHWHTAAEVVAAVKPVVYRARLDAAAGTDHPGGFVAPLA